MDKEGGSNDVDGQAGLHTKRQLPIRTISHTPSPTKNTGLG